MTRVLHLTPHLGGGVGRALSGLVAQAQNSQSGFEHRILSFELPEKTQFVDHIQQTGTPLLFVPSEAELISEVESADIVQLEFWNHPAIAHALCNAELPAMRLLVWCHVSGMNFPRIPPSLITNSQKFILTSECSFEAPEVKSLPPEHIAKLGVVSGGGGLELLPEPKFNHRTDLVAGYVGSLNFAKMHPDFVSFLSAVRTPGFQVRMFGDESNRPILEEQARDAGRPDLLDFRGYVTDVVAELQDLDIMPYILNPNHYGTGEIALLEAMAMGVVPIVLDNPAEMHIVKDRHTGLVVRTYEELANAVDWLSTNPEERTAMGRRAAAEVRTRYTSERLMRSLDTHYADIANNSPTSVSFNKIFGNTPTDWYRVFHRDPSMFNDNGVVHIRDNREHYILFERTKGSVFHFLDYFPEDPLLLKWAESLRELNPRSITTDGEKIPS